MRIKFLFFNNCVSIKTQYLCQDEFFNEESIAKVGISLSLKTPANRGSWGRQDRSQGL
jgi:hypothetical protein